MSVNYRTASIDVANYRTKCCQLIKEIGVDNILDLGEKGYDFLIQHQDEDGTYHEIDWEFILFDAHEHQLNKLIDNFQVKTVQEKLEDTAKETVMKVLGNKFKEEENA